MSNFVYYLNGEFVPADRAALPLNDVGIVRGYGVFDLLRTYGPVPFMLKEHLERLHRSAAQIDLNAPWSVEDLEQIVFATLERNGYPADVAIRIIVTGGPSATFMMPEDKSGLVVMLAPVILPNPAAYTDGAALITVNNLRFMPTVKSLNYISAIVAMKKAKRAGAVEALYRSETNLITECTTSNFFIFRGDRLITSADDVLPGVTRGAVLEIAGDSHEIEYRRIRYDELGSADEAFITSTTKEVMPIVRIDELTIGTGRVGHRTQALMEQFHQVVRMETQRM